MICIKKETFPTSKLWGLQSNKTTWIRPNEFVVFPRTWEVKPKIYGYESKFKTHWDDQRWTCHSWGLHRTVFLGTYFDTYQKQHDQVSWFCSFFDFRFFMQTYRAHITNLEARQWRASYLFPGNREFKQIILFLSSMHPQMSPFYVASGPEATNPKLFIWLWFLKTCFFHCQTRPLKLQELCFLLLGPIKRYGRRPWFPQETVHRRYAKTVNLSYHLPD